MGDSKRSPAPSVPTTTRLFSRALLDGLPVTLFNNVIAFLPMQTIYDCMSVDRLFRKKVRPHTEDNNYLWRQLFKIRWFHLYDAKVAKSMEFGSGLQWGLIFKPTYKKEYMDFPPRIRALLLPRESNLPHQDRDALIDAIELEDLSVEDSKGISLQSCIRERNRQSIFDTLYRRVIRKCYLKSDDEVDTLKADKWGRTILFWAIFCRQSRDEIKLLIAGGRAVTQSYSYPEDGDRFDPYRQHNVLFSPIHLAAREGHLEVVNIILISNPEMLNKATARGETPLILAARHGQLAVVQRLLTHKEIDLKATSFTPVGPPITALHEAVKGRFFDIVKALLAAGAVQRGFASGSAPIMHMAATLGCSDIVTMLIAHDFTLVSEVDRDGQTPLGLAAKGGYVTVVQALLAADPRLLNQGDASGRTPLSWAAGEGQTATVKMLLAETKVVPDQPDADGRDPLSWAASKGQAATVKQLLASPKVLPNRFSGGLPNCRLTPMGWAARQRHITVVKTLAEHDVALLSAVAELKEDSLISLAVLGGDLEVVEYILAKKVSSIEELTVAMHLAIIKNQHLTIIQALERHEPNLLLLPDSHGRSPFMMAVQSFDEPIFKYFLENPAVNLRDKWKDNTMVELAANARDAANRMIAMIVREYRVRGSYTIEERTHQASLAIFGFGGFGTKLPAITILLNHNPELLNSRDLDGKTLLMSAAANGDFDVVEYLLRQTGILIDTEAKCLSGTEDHRNTALHYACASGHDEIVKLLLKARVNVATQGPRTIKPILVNKTTPRTKALLDLAQYAANRPHGPEYKTTLSIFGCTLWRFGLSRERKTIAATRMMEYFFYRETGHHGGRHLTQDWAIADEVNQGDLGNIRQRLGFR